MRDYRISDCASSLTACVICKDARGQKLAHLLAERFSEVYWMASESNFSRFFAGDTEGTILSSRKIPNRVNGIFFHSSDEQLLQKIDIQADFVFEFNSPGTPIKKPGNIRILKQTAPYFAIDADDVQEVAQYLRGHRQVLPRMCYEPIEASLALWLLCQSFLAAHQNNKNYHHQRNWWLQGLGYGLDSDTLSHEVSHLRHELRSEWLQGQNRSTSMQPIESLLDSFRTFGESSPVIVSEMVEKAYHALADQFHYPTQPVPAVYDSACGFQNILWLSEDRLAAAAAIAISTLFNLPAVNGQSCSSSKIPPSYLLVVSKSTIRQVPKKRLNGFRGPILVIASEPFSVLKQQYRVLRFGQGTHAAFNPTQSLADLPELISDLVPLEPENLSFLQMDLRESQNIYQQHVLPCVERLKAPRENFSEDIDYLQQIIKRLRVKTPVACHEIVTISDESASLQRHFCLAVAELGNPENYNDGLKRLSNAFEAWHEKVSATGESFVFA